VSGDPARTRLWWTASAACAAAILCLAVLPVADGPAIPYLDKVVHVCEYLLFAWLLVQAVRAGQCSAREYLWMAWIYAASYGWLMELIQGMIPWRSMDLGDALANMLGAAGGVWAGRLFPRPSAHR